MFRLCGVGISIGTLNFQKDITDLRDTALYKVKSVQKYLKDETWS